MGEMLFGLGGLVIGSVLGFVGRLYFERRAERRADSKEAFGAVLAAVEAKDQGAFGTADTRLRGAIVDMRRALGSLTRPAGTPS